MSTDQERMEDGLRIRKEILGAENVDRTMGSVSDFNREWQDYVNRGCWGEVWAREGLDRRTRSMLTMAILATLGREGELATHTRAAFTNGCTAEDIKEVFFHVSVYAGVPAAFAAFRIGQPIADELAGGS